MSILEVNRVELKTAHRLFALVPIPRVSQKHAADVPEQRSNSQRFLQSRCWLVTIHSRMRMVIAPVEPVVLQEGNRFKALSDSGSRHRATAKIPFAAAGID